MNEVQAGEMRRKLQELQEKVDSLESLRDKLLGMGWATSTALKIIVSLIGVGGLAACARLIVWLSQPIKH